MTPSLPARAARPRHLAAIVLTALIATLLSTGSAVAATAKTSTITSSNWSGYAAHGSSTTFSAVSGRWRIPAATCEKGDQSFASFWVGIGGYSESSNGLEQDGTELDCETDGTERVSAWYELLPAAPHTVSLSVHSGDLMSASVRLSGHEVTLTITDLTTRKVFTKTVHDTDIDNTSAEWIAEAPSDCSNDDQCDVLPLTDFGAVRFSNATATSTTGVTSGIRTSRWTTTKLLLGYREDGSDFVEDTDSGHATTSALTDDAREFLVTWTGSTTSSTSSSGSTGSGSSGTGSSGTGSSGSGGSGSTGPGSGGPGGYPNPGGGGFGGGGFGGSGPGGK